MFEITRRETLSRHGIHKIIVRAPLVAAKARAGEFVVIMISEFGERIPIGVLYRGGRPPFEAGVPGLSGGPMALRTVDLERLSATQTRF